MKAAIWLVSMLLLILIATRKGRGDIDPAGKAEYHAMCANFAEIGYDFKIRQEGAVWVASVAPFATIGECCIGVVEAKDSNLTLATLRLIDLLETHEISIKALEKPEFVIK